MDFLGLTNLTILDRAIKLLDESQGIHIDLDRLPLDDSATFELLSSGDTNDLFQLESAGMQRYIKELKPSSLSDISAMIALYRPGPMENIDTFIDAKFGRVPITYPHPSLKDLLDETYGIIVYQDQVLLILQQFAGYSLGAADIVRKAMGKKIPELMAQERDRFVEGARNKGFDEKVAVDIFDLIEPFAGYAFNKGPQRQLCAHLLLDGLFQGPLSPGIHGVRPQFPQGQPRQGGEFHHPNVSAWAYRCCRRT